MSRPTTLITVRKYRPLDICFPPPGVYIGLVAVVLPNPDPVVLSRLTENGSQPPMLTMTCEEPISAREIYEIIKKKVPELERLSREVSSPVNAALLQRLQIARALDRGGGRKPTIAPTSGADNPLEAPQIEIEPPPVDDTARMVE